MVDTIASKIQAIRDRLAGPLAELGCFVVGAQNAQKAGLTTATRQVQVAFQRAIYSKPLKIQPTIQDITWRFELTLRAKDPRSSDSVTTILCKMRDLLTGFCCHTGQYYFGYLIEEGFVGLDDNQYYIYAQIFALPGQHVQLTSDELAASSARLVLEEGGALQLEEGGDFLL